MSARTKPHPKGANNPRGLKDIPFALPDVTDDEKKHAKKLADALKKHYPDAHCELDFSNPHELLIATILSAQSTDAGVNKATPGLFKKFKTPRDYAKSTPEKIEPYISTIGLFRNKAKSVHSAMTTIVEEFGGEVPGTMDELLTLRGVARKTANVVLGNAFDKQEGITVDTHVMRLAWRWDLCSKDDGSPLKDGKKIEQKLMALFPRPRWTHLGHAMVLHGRYNCTARPNCAHDHPICEKFGVNCDKPYKK